MTDTRSETRREMPALDELLAIDNSNIRSLIDENVTFEGKLTVKGDAAILISGKVIGEVVSDGVVIINSDAVVEGSVSARCLQLGGTIMRRNQNDKVDVGDVLVLARGARLQCDAIYGDMKAEHGVRIAGAIQPRDLEEVKPVHATASVGAQVISLNNGGGEHSPQGHQFGGGSQAASQF